MRTTPFKLGELSGYAVAIALTSTALFLSLILQVPFGNPFWFFFPVAVIASTWFGGRDLAGSLCCSAPLAALYYFIPPVRSFAVKPRISRFF